MKTTNELLTTAKSAAHMAKLKTQEAEVAAGGVMLGHPQVTWFLIMVLAMGLARAASQTFVR